MDIRENASWVLFIVAIAGIYFAVLGVPVVEDIPNFIALAVVAAFVLYIVYHFMSAIYRSKYYSDWERGRAAGIFIIFVFVVAIWLFVSQLSGTYCLTPLKYEFRCVAGNHDRTFVPLADSGGDRRYGYSYHGKLDKIVSRRNSMMRELGFVGCCDWLVTSSILDTRGGYLWVTPWISKRIIKNT